MKNVTMGSLLFAIIASMVAWALIRNLPGLLEVLVALATEYALRARRMPLLLSLTTHYGRWCDDGVRIAGRLVG